MTLSIRASYSGCYFHFGNFQATRHRSNFRVGKRGEQFKYGRFNFRWSCSNTTVYKLREQAKWPGMPLKKNKRINTPSIDPLFLSGKQSKTEKREDGDWHNMHTWPQPCRVVQSPSLPRCQDPGLLSQIMLWFAGFVTVLANTWDFELENLRSSNFRKIAVRKLRLRWGWRGEFSRYHLTTLLIRVFGEPKDGVFSKFRIVWDIEASSSL